MFVGVKPISSKRRQILTSTDVEYTSGNPDGERGGLGPSREDTEQDVNDVFLTHKDRDKKVRNDSVGNPSDVYLVSCRKVDEYGHIE